MIGGRKNCIGLIFGGNSNEHEISISSAKTVYQAFNSEINKEFFTVKPFYINKYGDWLDSDNSEKILIDEIENNKTCLLYTSPSPRDATLSRMPSSA